MPVGEHGTRRSHFPFPSRGYGGAERRGSYVLCITDKHKMYCHCVGPIVRPQMGFRLISMTVLTRPYCPISKNTLAGDVLPEVETVIGYSPSATCGTMKFTWYCPGATNAAANTTASVVPMVTPTPIIGTAEVSTLPEGEGPNPAA